MSENQSRVVTRMFKEADELKERDVIVSKDTIFIKRRMYRIFRDDGRSLVVAMDHGSGLDVYPALARPACVLDAVVAGGADAILTTPGIVKQFSQHLSGAGLPNLKCVCFRSNRLTSSSNLAALNLPLTIGHIRDTFQ